MKVAFFPGCLVDMFYPEVGMAAVRVLERLGCDVELPDKQVCCGQPLFNSGFGKASAPIVKNAIDAYADYETIVSLSGSCAYALKEEAMRFVGDDAAYRRKLSALAPRIHEFTEFIVDVLGVVDVGARLDGTATYHRSCHLTRCLGIERQPLALLSAVEGLSLVEMRAADRCCGFGGTFSFKEPEISEQIVREKTLAALECGADFLVGADQCCLMNIKGCLDRMRERGETNSPLRVLHIAQILDMRKGA
ncbi:hypothetical protein B5F40_11885 [Gordonibacter sp. An230]|uniref:(Fe-S)-binding protein n=1 Tax=Gordonibacter sp. An230 TaxID=1965592 RepID=UPI000B397E40|nr:(Fe-S)-binding protein [Gordonibacter sp. An230]OUO88905.1 hypothetical protein B5F40_11885 [Gordonibacter sp. An230]